MTKRLNFSWRTQPYKGSKMFTLIRYLQSQPLKSELITKAINAYYYPLALGKSDSENKLVAFQSILELIEQIHHICLHCGINENQVQQLVLTNFGQENIKLQQPVTKQPLPQETNETDDFDPDLLHLFCFDNYMIKKEFK